MNEIVIGNKILNGRKERGLSQAQFADLFNISPQAVSKWERGDSLPDIIMLSKIAKELGVDLRYFSDETDESKIESDKPSKSKNMSFMNWKNADFSELDNLGSKLNYANIELCKFKNADLRDIVFKANNMCKNDFSDAKMCNCKFSAANIEGNSFANADLTGLQANNSNIDKNIFSDANLSNTAFKHCNFDENDIANVNFYNTEFYKCSIKKITFSGTLNACSFVLCNYRKVLFDGVTMKDVFFKGKVKGATFVNCKADRLTYEFLKSANADVTNITIG